MEERIEGLGGLGLINCSGDRIFVVMPAHAGIQRGGKTHANRFWRETTTRNASGLQPSLE